MIFYMKTKFYYTFYSIKSVWPFFLNRVAITKALYGFLLILFENACFIFALWEENSSKATPFSKPVWFLLLCLPVFVFAEVGVHSSLNPKRVSPQDTVTLTVEIEYQSAGHISSPRLPPLSDFYLVSQSQRQSFQIINGQSSSKKEYQYTLRPRKEGTLRVEAIEVTVDGRVYKTAPLEVEVSSQIPPRPKSRLQPRLFGRGLDPFFPFFEGKPLSEKDIFLKLEVDKSKAYLNEMVLAEWFFYRPMGSPGLNSEVTKSPRLNGFWVESVFQLGMSPSAHQQRTEINGRPYIKQKIIASALFPVQTGPLTIGALSAKTWQAGFRAFSGSPKIQHKKSNTKSITVMPLPEEGQDKSWTGAVGDFVVFASLNKNIVSAGDPVVYKVLFKGQGHPRVIRLPQLHFGPGFDVYDITESQQFSLSESQKIFEVILFPRSTGDLSLPSFELSTFDPALGIYKTHVLPALKLKVTGIPLPDSRKEKGEKYFADENQTTKARSAPVGPWTEHRQNLFLKHRKTFWLVLYGFLLLFFLLASYKRFFFIKKKKSLFSKMYLKEGLKKVDRAIKNQEWKQTSILLNEIMNHFLMDLMEEDTQVTNKSLLLQKLPPSIRIKYAEPVRSLFSQLEKLSFAPDEETKEIKTKQNILKLKRTMLGLIVKINQDMLGTKLNGT